MLRPDVPLIPQPTPSFSGRPDSSPRPPHLYASWKAPGPSPELGVDANCHPESSFQPARSRSICRR